MQNDEQEIRQLVATWLQATKEGSTEAVLALMADDVVFLIAGQPPMIGKSAFAAAMQSPPGQLRPDFESHSEIQQIEICGDFAYIWTKLSVTITPPGSTEPMVRSGHTLSILRKYNGKWLLTRDANMLSPVSGKACN